jgi:hypothetical protein
MLKTVRPQNYFVFQKKSLYQPRGDRARNAHQNQMYQIVVDHQSQQGSDKTDFTTFRAI